MPDPYATIADQDVALQSHLADVLELRGTDEVQNQMIESYLSRLDLPEGANVLEVGCGTGHVTRILARLPGVASVTGVDPSPVFIARARALNDPDGNIECLIGDGHELEFAPATFDLVVFHTTLTHMPDPVRALTEACRVLKPGGCMAIFDGDYVTASVATSENDPLQSAVEVAIRRFVTNPWFVRTLPGRLAASKLQLESFRSHSYTQVADPAYMLSIVRRGIDVMRAEGTVDADTAQAMGSEADRRAATGAFFGHISYASAIVRKPEATGRR